MLKMRLQRVGRKHEPSFRLVLTDSQNSTKSGRTEEILGSYDARKTNEKFNAERIKHWLSQGVGLTPTVNNLLIKHGIVRGKKIDVVPARPAPVVEATVAPAPEASQAEAAPVVEAASVEAEVSAPAEPVAEVSDSTSSPQATEEAPAPTEEVSN